LLHWLPSLLFAFRLQFEAFWTLFQGFEARGTSLGKSQKCSRVRSCTWKIRGCVSSARAITTVTNTTITDIIRNAAAVDTVVAAINVIAHPPQAPPDIELRRNPSTATGRHHALFPTR
jgi:hypothetical protein